MKTPYGSLHRFARQSLQLLYSDAYLLLTPIERLILQDLIFEYERATRWGRDELDRYGFPYSYGMCKVPCSKSSFKASMKRLHAMGFIRPAYRPKTGYPTHWTASTRWRRLKATGDDEATVKAFRTRIAKYDPNNQASQEQFQFALVHFPSLDTSPSLEATRPPDETQTNSA